MDKISVIVPVYNLENCLARCLDSILAQTHENLEVIVVDDGSRDNSCSVMKAYADRDSRVRAIRQENRGVTAARLRGVAAATGQWIGFIDGDDEIEPHMYQRLLQNAKDMGADISHCGYQRKYPDGKVEYHFNTGVLRRQDHTAGLRDLLEERLVEPGLCSKLFRAELFSGLQEKMDPSIKINEDMLMNYHLFAKAQSSVHEDICPYHYLLRENSASRRQMNEYRIYDPIRVREIILEGCEPELKETAMESLLRVLLFVYALLTVEKGGGYAAHMARIRQLLRKYAPHFPVMTVRNRVLARMICHTPWLFRPVFRAYVQLALGGHYE